MRTYKPESIISSFTKDEEPYQKSVVNYLGNASDGTSYNEVLAKYIFDSKNFKIQPYSNVKSNFSYKNRTAPHSKKSEKWLCNYWLTHGFDDKEVTKELGRPVERELNIVPNTKINVDLVTYNNVKETLFLVEVKGKKTKESTFYSTDETLLRCILEVETYYESLVPSFEEIKNSMNDIVVRRAKYLKKAILVPEGSFAAKQINSSDFPYVNALLHRYDISAFVYKNTLGIDE
jgi:hypothetical protein